MNTQTNLELETPTPLEEIKRADRPRYDVPIMIEITQWDLDNAKEYCDSNRCLIATSLTRLGYSRFSVGPDVVTFFGDPWHTFQCDGIKSDDLQSAKFVNGEIHKQYKHDLLGKQIILYPV